MGFLKARNASAIDRRRVTRTMSSVENKAPSAITLVGQGWRATDCAPVIGVTGPPGAGKSSLVDGMAIYWAELGLKVAVLAVDPSSPFTGGAILGDRFRMERASAHPNVFIRSISSRGQLGAVSETTSDILVVIGMLGFDVVILETVGAGQSDVAVATLADAVIVVSVPGLGDQVQAAKAGILEIGDVFVVNKSDLAGASAVAGHIRSSLDLVYPGRPGTNDAASATAQISGNAKQQRRHGMVPEATSYWKPPVLEVSGLKDVGIATLCETLDVFLDWSHASGSMLFRRTRRVEERILLALQTRLTDHALNAAGQKGIGLDALSSRVTGGEMSPDEAAQRIFMSSMGDAS